MSNYLGQLNVTVRMGLLERVMASTLTTLPCCLFLSINVLMLLVLRSKPVFCETSRYILLFNLLFADTVQILLAQVLLIVSACRIMLTYPVCGFLSIIMFLTNLISPLTLIVMSLERYVAVCYPFRHATIITARNTAKAILVVWAISSLNVLIQGLLLHEFPFQDLDSLVMESLCSGISMFLMPENNLFDTVYTTFVFISSIMTVICSYIGVTVAARAASTDQASAQKARNTLLLHMVQLGLSLCTTIHSLILNSLSRISTWLVFVRLQVFFYILIVISPRCLSSLIYGLRDQSIRPVFMYHLCCQVKISLISDKF